MSGWHPCRVRLSATGQYLVSRPQSQWAHWPGGAAGRGARSMTHDPEDTFEVMARGYCVEVTYCVLTPGSDAVLSRSYSAVYTKN